MEDRNEPQFTIADLMQALKAERTAHEDTGRSIVQYSRAIVDAHNKGDKAEAMHQLDWMEMEVRTRDALYQRIRRVEMAIRTLNRFTKPYRD